MKKEQETSISEIEKILNAPRFQETLAQIAQQKGISIAKVNSEAEDYLKELYTEHKPVANAVLMEAAEYILGRGYDKTIDVNPDEIKALTKLMRTNSIAFVLTHKAYYDLLVLALVLARHGLPLPYMFAGINLDLFGVGKLARQAGVIYIRRSFKDNPVYKATLRHFITSYVNKQAHFMWALEGTRSRTGKLVWPQMGILKYILEAEEEATQPVKYVPVSIVYDLIPDVQEMTKEGRGKEKKGEDLIWLVNYVRKMGGNLGRISLRIGEPVNTESVRNAPIPDDEETEPMNKASISHLAFDLVHRINQITPVTTTSLICTALLSKFALTKRSIESDIADLMQLIESHKRDALVDRGKPIGESVQVALNLLTKAHIFLQQGEGLNAKYTIFRENYLPATYYANMAVHHLYHRAFIELALVKIMGLPAEERLLAFWTEIMSLRDVFKFEFFYSKKAQFTNEIETDLKSITPDWETRIFKTDSDIKSILEDQKVLVSPVLLFNYIEAYRVVAHGLQTWDVHQELDEKKLLNFCLFLGEEMHWQGRIRRIEAVSKPFLQNGIRLIKNVGLIPSLENPKTEAIAQFIQTLEDVANRINTLQGIILSKPIELTPSVPVERDIVPGSTTEVLTRSIIDGESGAHIGAFFDLDRTLIKGFSAKDFAKARILSGKFTAKEIVAQFAGVLSYATGNGNFASMAAIGAKGVQGVKEQVFIEVGEEVYQKHLAGAIYPESRALVAAHLAKGHTVAIVSAATPYQVDPIARDLGIPHVMCTRMEVEDGVFTGNIIKPACWGEGKAIAGQKLADEYGLDLQKSYFYTDSVEDLPLLEIVGNPRPMNPDAKLTGLAFKNDWPVYRFDENESSKAENLIRTTLTAGAFVPAVLSGVLRGGQNMSWSEGVDAMMASFGDIGTAVAGIQIAVKGEEHLWSQRPAVFIFNHQSSADLLIAAKLIRKQARGVAKKELKKMPILGQLMTAAGTIFLDRGDKEKSIEALKPAVESLKNGTSVIIFPEGTRSYDYTLGKFKKGAFHLAMQAQVPLVPVVIKNAHDAMPRGTNLFRPTAVEVVVLPPVSTEGWTSENLNEKVDAVRRLYLQELGQEAL
jgi:putative phosphoserine phosphatase/1-acylglycerol-3-phosphate O-acyltransferase